MPQNAMWSSTPLSVGTSDFWTTWTIVIEPNARKREIWPWSWYEFKHMAIKLFSRSDILGHDCEVIHPCNWHGVSPDRVGMASILYFMGPTLNHDQVGEFGSAPDCPKTAFQEGRLSRVDPPILRDHQTGEFDREQNSFLKRRQGFARALGCDQSFQPCV